MKNEKVILYIIAAIVLVSAGFIAGHTVRKTVDNKTIREYRSTVTELGIKLTEKESAIAKLTERNGQLINQAEKLRETIRDIVKRFDNAKRIIAEIESGLSGDLETLSDIRKAIRVIIQAVSKFGETE